MDVKASIIRNIERENAYLGRQPVGSEEYNKSLGRLNGLNDQLMNFEKLEEERRNQKFNKGLEIVKTTSGIVVPVGMGLVILKWEEKGSITTVLRQTFSNFIPKKIF